MPGPKIVIEYVRVSTEQQDAKNQRHRIRLPPSPVFSNTCKLPRPYDEALDPPGRNLPAQNISLDNAHLGSTIVVIPHREPMKVFTSVKTGSVSELVEAQTQKTILDGVLKPGNKLPPEREIVELFQASRISVREALQILANSGVVYVRGGLGRYVSEVNSRPIAESLSTLLQIQSASLDHLTEARLILEPSAAKPRRGIDGENYSSCVYKMDYGICCQIGRQNTNVGGGSKCGSVPREDFGSDSAGEFSGGV